MVLQARTERDAHQRFKRSPTEMTFGVISHVPEEQDAGRSTDLKVSYDVSKFSTVFYAFKQRVLPLPPP